MGAQKAQLLLKFFYIEPNINHKSISNENQNFYNPIIHDGRICLFAELLYV